MTGLILIAVAALCLAFGTAEMARRGLTLPQALLLTALPWGLLTAGALGSGASLWTVGGADAVLSVVIAARITIGERRP